MDRNTIIGFVLIGILLMAYFAINSKEQKQYQGTPATAVYNYLKAVRQGDSSSITASMHPNSNSTDMLLTMIKDSEIRNTFLSFDSAAIKMDPPIEENGLTKVRIFENQSSNPLEFYVALNPQSQYKVVSNEKLLVEMLKYHRKDTVSISDSIRKIYNKYLAQLTPRKIENKSTTFNPNTKTAAITSVENDVIKVEFSSIGAQPRSVYLKNYNRYDGKIVKLNSSDSSQFNYNLLAAFGNDVNISQINFTLSKNTVNPDQSKTIEFVAQDSVGNMIKHTYTMRPGDYMIDLDISIQSASKSMQGKQIALEWKVEAPKIEKDSKYELTQQHFCHYSEDSYDFNYCQQNDKVELQSTDWIAVKQQFFLSALVAKNKFSSVNTSWTVSQDPSSDYLTRTSATAIYPLQSNGSVAIPLRMYFGPSDYNILKNYNNHMQSIVPYGSGIFAFVKYINRHFLLPVFDWLKNHIANMGIVILLITLLIRLITSPILYKSYLSGAKMKALKPEVDALRAKYKDDQQAFGMEQMKLWRSAGVSPLGGCIPALLQIPIFMSLYFFFQSNIGLRGASFLWSQDLSQYDSIANLPFSIPFYGDHVSLFTITAVLTSLLISLYGMSNMQDNNNPFMKYLPFIFPVLLLGVFNSLPAALTWYYTISNSITLIMQIVIQKYIINHEKILADINENRKKPVKKSKMQERIEAMQESQRKLQEMKKKGKV